MNMAVRNFWIEADIDDRASTLAGGPRSRHGGMTVKIYQRDNGAGTSKPVIKLNCWEGEETLHTRIEVNGKTVTEYITKR